MAQEIFDYARMKVTKIYESYPNSLTYADLDTPITAGRETQAKPILCFNTYLAPRPDCAFGLSPTRSPVVISYENSILLPCYNFNRSWFIPELFFTLPATSQQGYLPYAAYQRGCPDNRWGIIAEYC